MCAVQALLESVVEQIERVEHSEEHGSELPLAWTPEALAKEIGYPVEDVEAALTFLIAEGRVMTRRHGRSETLLYKKAIDGDTIHTARGGLIR